MSNPFGFPKKGLESPSWQSTLGSSALSYGATDWRELAVGLPLGAGLAAGAAGLVSLLPMYAAVPIVAAAPTAAVAIGGGAAVGGTAGVIGIGGTLGAVGIVTAGQVAKTGIVTGAAWSLLQDPKILLTIAAVAVAYLYLRRKK